MPNTSVKIILIIMSEIRYPQNLIKKLFWYLIRIIEQYIFVINKWNFKFLLKSNTLFYDLLLLLGTGSNVTSSTASQSTTFSAWTSDSSLKTESFYLAEHKKPYSRNLSNRKHEIIILWNQRFAWYRLLTKVLNYKKMKPSCQNRISQIQIRSSYHRLHMNYFRVYLLIYNT